LVDDGHGDADSLHLVVEIKGYRREDAKEKKAAMETYWVRGVNNDGQYGRWAFAEFTEVYQIESDFMQRVESEFDNMIQCALDNGTDHRGQLLQAQRYAAKHFGDDAKWSLLTDKIWAAMGSDQDHAFQLSQLDDLAESVSCKADDALALLGL